MAFLAAGSMGHVSVNDLCMDITEVTAGAYAACVEHKECTPDDLTCDDAPTWGRPDLANHPINCVSWDQADGYCRAHQKRLPTREEWEWAAGARGERRRFAWGSTEPAESQMCWSLDAPRTGTCSAGSFPASRTPEGIDDLFGGVWEWLSPRERGGVPHVARGGSWQNDSIETLEGDDAGAFLPGFVRNDVVGFRCVADPAR